MTMKACTSTEENNINYEEHVNKFRQKAFLERDFDAIDEYLTSDFIDHFAPPWDPPGRAGVRLRFGQAAEAFQTTEVEILHSMTQGNILMQAILIHLRHTGDFMGVPATGQELEIGGFDAFEFRDGKLSGHWGVYDVSRIPDLLHISPPPPKGASCASWASMWGSGVARS